MERHNLNRLNYFVAIVEEKTITAAAERLGLSKAVVSKHLQLLEQELGVNLLVRNTRHLYPTHAGEDFYSKSKEVLIHAANAFESVLETGQTPKGRIRLTAPVDFGVHRLSGLISRFSHDYPEIDVDLELSDERVDIVAQRFDLAFRIGWLKDSSNVSRKLSDFRLVTVCTPDTANKWGVKKPEDLQSKPYISFADIDISRLEFSQKSKRRRLQLQSRVTINVTLGIRKAVLSGNCFAILPDFNVRGDLAEKRLVELLPSWKLRSGGIYMVSPPSRLRTQAIRLFMDRVVAELGDYQ